MCFEMVGAHPSGMPDMFDGDGILAQTEIRGVRKCDVDPGIGSYLKQQ